MLCPTFMHFHLDSYIVNKGEKRWASWKIQKIWKPAASSIKFNTAIVHEYLSCNDLNCFFCRFLLQATVLVNANASDDRQRKVLKRLGWLTSCFFAFINCVLKREHIDVLQICDFLVNLSRAMPHSCPLSYFIDFCLLVFDCPNIRTSILLKISKLSYFWRTELLWTVEISVHCLNLKLVYFLYCNANEFLYFVVSA
jgi:hypothetical protein